MSRATSFSDPAATAFRAEVRSWAASTIPVEWRELASGQHSNTEMLQVRRHWDQLVSSGGYAGLSWPVEYGGKGLGVLEEFIFYEEVAIAGAPDMLNFIGFDLAGPAIIAFGTEAQKAELLPAILAGEHLWCEGFSEPDAGSDMAAVSTTAVFDQEAGGYVVNGQKIWTSLAQAADKCYLLARTSSELPRHHNLSIMLLDMKQDGVDVRPLRQITGDSEFSEVFFTDCFVPGGGLLGNENEGWHLATLAGFRRDRRLFDALRRYVIIERIVTQLESCAAESTVHGIADAVRKNTDMLRWHIMRCAELTARGEDAAKSASILRIVWSELWQRAVAAGLELKCDEHEALWRREYLFARSVTIAGGTTQIQRNVVADRVLDLPR